MIEQRVQRAAGRALRSLEPVTTRLLAGFWGCRAGLPAPPTAPTVREFQQAQFEVAVEWAERELA